MFCVVPVLQTNIRCHVPIFLSKQLEAEDAPKNREGKDVLEAWDSLANDCKVARLRAGGQCVVQITVVLYIIVRKFIHRTMSGVLAACNYKDVERPKM